MAWVIEVSVVRVARCFIERNPAEYGLPSDRQLFNDFLLGPTLNPKPYFRVFRKLHYLSELASENMTVVQNPAPEPPKLEPSELYLYIYIS